MTTVQQPLFAVGPQRISAPAATLMLHCGFLDTRDADEMLQILLAQTPWRQDRITIFGKTHDLPRMQQWYGDVPYTYSGIEIQPQPWTDALARLRVDVQERTGSSFNSCLANLYRDGDDTVGWHSDDEPELGAMPCIASVSLGAERMFVLRHKRWRDLKRKIVLPHGSLLVMSGATQQNWEHTLPRRAGLRDPRVNLTFRSITPTR